MADAKVPHLTSLAGANKSPGDANLIDVGRMVRGIRERWLGTLVCALLVCGVTGFILFRQAPVYAANTTLLIERSTDRVVDIKQVVDTTVESSLTDALLLTHTQQIRSQPFLVEVAKSFSPEEQARIIAPYLGKAQKARAPGADRETGDVAVEDVLEAGLKVERAGRTLLISVSMRHRDPEMTQQIANRVADQYITHLLDRSTASNDSALSFLTGQVEDLRRKLESAEKKAQAYREEHNLVFLDQNQNVGVERLRTLSTSVTQARVARLAIDARLAQIEDIMKSNGDMRQLASAAEFTAFGNVQKQIDELKAKRDALAERYGRMHPQMLENASSLQTLERLRAQHLAAALSDLRNQREKAQIEENQLRSELATAERESLARDQLASAYHVLRREVDTTRETYSQLLARFNETTISSRLQNTNVKVVGRANLPVRPVEPNQIKIIAILAMLGAFVVVAYPWTAQVCDKRIRGCADIEGYLEGTLIGEIPATAEVLGRRAQIVSRASDQSIVEAFRGLYGQFRLSRRDTSKVVLVTSTIPAEGKSFVACNLAGSFAAHGHRTLLIDADLRRPTLHDDFDLDNRNGLLVWLNARREVKDSLVLQAALGIKEVAPGLFLLRAGGVSTRLTELLQRDALRELIDDLKRQFQVILIDTSPAGVFHDAEAFSTIADEFVYVCRFKGPERAHARQTLDRLAKSDMSLRGIVLNGVPGGQRGAYYMSSYSQGARRYRKDYAALA